MTDGWEPTHAPNPTRKPRASFTITMLDDPDFIALVQRGAAGNRALVIFWALVMLAKRLRNDGRFSQPVEVIAPMVWAAPREILAAGELIAEVCKLNRSRPWLALDKGRLCVRSFGKWNEEKRGGPREGAGRPPSKSPKPKPPKAVIRPESNRNQIDYEVNSKPCASVSVSDSELNQQQQTPAAAAGAAMHETAEPAAGGGGLRAALLEAGIGEPALAELAASEHLTPAVVRQTVAAAREAGKRNGAVVLNLRAAAQARAVAADRQAGQAAARAEQEAHRDATQQREAEAAAAAQARYDALTPEELAAHREAVYASLSERARRTLKPDSQTMRAYVVTRLTTKPTGATG